MLNSLILLLGLSEGGQCFLINKFQHMSEYLRCFSWTFSVWLCAIFTPYFIIIFENNEKKQYRYWNSLPDKKSKLKLELHFNNATRFQTPCLYYAYT